MTLDLKDRLYTSSEVAEILGVSLRSVYRYLEEGKLDADVKTATGRHRFSRKNILDFLQPGGITKDQVTEKNNIPDDDEIDVLDLPAINKSKISSEKDSELDDFNFDLDEDFFKSLNFDSIENTDKKAEQNNINKNQIQDGEFVDDDLEKLLKEFEEKEGLSHSDNSPQNIKNDSNDKKDDFDFDLDSFFKDLEENSNKEGASSNSLNSFENNNHDNRKNLEKDDFDFDFDGLDKFFENEEKEKKEPEVKLNQASSEEDSEDNWLERFRKAALTNSSSVSKSTESGDKLKDYFFESSNFDHFFDKNSNSSSKKTEIESVSSIGFSSQPEVKSSATKEYYYSSSLNGLKEIAQNIDKVAKKFDTDYAFTMNAGLSLHKPISPFTIIHAYVRGRDLELFEDYLNLTPVEYPSEASVCLMVSDGQDIFEDAYDLHGLYVVSNVQLRSDLIDKGLDKLAREI